MTRWSRSSSGVIDRALGPRGTLLAFSHGVIFASLLGCYLTGGDCIEDCFLALILYKYLAKKVNRAGKHFSPDEIIGTLQDMNFLSIAGEGYIPTYTRTDLTNNLHGSAGFRTDTQIVSKQKMKKIITEAKKSSLRNNGE